MNEQQLAAVKQALDALKRMKRYGDTFAYRSSEQNPYEQVCEAITDCEQAIAQDALDKMAEDARTIGLRLDDWDKIGCVNHDCDKCKAVQEPSYRCQPYSSVPGAKVSAPVDYYTTPPAAQKPWVGLTDEEAQWIYDNGRTPSGMMEMVEAKLKEKNT